MMKTEREKSSDPLSKRRSSAIATRNSTFFFFNQRSAGTSLNGCAGHESIFETQSIFYDLERFSFVRGRPSSALSVQRSVTAARTAASDVIINRSFNQSWRFDSTTLLLSVSKASVVVRLNLRNSSSHVPLGSSNTGKLLKTA